MTQEGSQCIEVRRLPLACIARLEYSCCSGFSFANHSAGVDTRRSEDNQCPRGVYTFNRVRRSLDSRQEYGIGTVHERQFDGPFSFNESPECLQPPYEDNDNEV